MAWRDDIQPGWSAPTIILDGMMQTEIVRQFFPQMDDPCVASAAMPFTRVRQITDRPMAASMLIPSDRANQQSNDTRHNNVERLRRLIEVRAHDVYPGRMLVVTQAGLEMALRAGALPQSVDLAHYNAVAGQNAWSNAALVMVVGRTEPSPRDVEATARPLFGAQVQQVEEDENGRLWWPVIRRGILLRDGSAVAVDGHFHPDPRAEAVRWSICEAEVMQAIGRARGVNRTADNPLQIDILTNVVLPIEVDEVTTWERIQPTVAQVMRARGAVPVNYHDMVAAYPDLFPSGSQEAARKALERENPRQTPIEIYLIRVCPGFSVLRYRRTGSRGPAPQLLYDPSRIHPLPWLTQRLGEVIILQAAIQTVDRDALECVVA